MADPLFTTQQLRDRLSSLVVDRIYDDDGDGSADTNPLDQLRKDATAKVRSDLGPVYDAALLLPDVADVLTLVALDVAHAMAAQRHPEILRIDGYRMMEQAERQLKKIRTGVSNLGITGSPEPAANVGGTVYPGLPATDEYPTRSFFRDGTGDF